MENKQTMKVRIDDAIALCHIIDEFETFSENLINFLTVKSDSIAASVYKLSKIAKGENCLGAQRIKQFYNDNKYVIDVIRKYSYITEFIFAHYNFGSNIEICTHDLYKYILENRDKLDNILAVLERLKKLGFDSFKFNTTLDFSEQTYTAYRILSDNLSSVIYLDNLEAIPSYDYDVKYRASGSNYLMKLNILIGKIASFGNEITLNSLTFDVNRLPKTLSLEETLYKILALQQEKEQEYHIIRNSVDLSIGIDDLYLMYSEIQRKFNKLEGVDSKESLLEELRKVKEALDQMTILSQEYDKQMVANNEGITESLLTEEKEAYVRRREWAKMDLD